MAKNQELIIPAKILTHVTFACDYADACNRRFVLDHLPWVIKTNYSQLESIIRPLLVVNNDNTGKNDAQLPLYFSINQKQKV